MVCSVVLGCLIIYFFFFFFKQKTAYEMRISDWSSDVCSSDLSFTGLQHAAYAALNFVIKSFSRSSITEARSYRERLIALMESFVEVVDQASEDGLEVINNIMNSPASIQSRQVEAIE